MTSRNPVPRKTDASLARKARDGDQQAFAELFQRYGDKVFDEAFGMVREWDVADGSGRVS